MATLKTCFKCQSAKPLSDFYRHPGMADGHLGKCKGCTKKDVSQHRSANIDAIRAYDRRRGLRNAEQVRGWIRQNPLRRAAHNAVRNAVRDGRVVPWPACAMPECDAKPEAHHPDYGAPLSVVWLCPCHHKQAHALVRQIKQEES